MRSLIGPTILLLVLAGRPVPSAPRLTPRLGLAAAEQSQPPAPTPPPAAPARPQSAKESVTRETSPAPPAPKAEPEPAPPTPTPAAPAPAPPAAPPAGQSPPKPRVLSPREPGGDGVTEEVHARLAHTEKIIAQIDPGALTQDRREIYAGIQDFVVKAKEALSAKDLPRARNLAEKASTLADDLAKAVKSSQ
jgi:hypothetical protein